MTNYSRLFVVELKKLLNQRAISYSARAKKQQLIDLLKQDDEMKRFYFDKDKQSNAFTWNEVPVTSRDDLVYNNWLRGKRGLSTFNINEVDIQLDKHYIPDLRKMITSYLYAKKPQKTRLFRFPEIAESDRRFPDNAVVPFNHSLQGIIKRENMPVIRGDILVVHNTESIDPFFYDGKDIIYGVTKEEDSYVGNKLVHPSVFLVNEFITADYFDNEYTEPMHTFADLTNAKIVKQDGVIFKGQPKTVEKWDYVSGKFKKEIHTHKAYQAWIQLGNGIIYRLLTDREVNTVDDLLIFREEDEGEEGEELPHRKNLYTFDSLFLEIYEMPIESRWNILAIELNRK